jgi:hypothetical protein
MRYIAHGAFLSFTLQAGERSALRQRAADLESMLSATQKRCADLAAELASVRSEQLPVQDTGSSEAERLACLQGSAAALARCSLGQLYRSAFRLLSWFLHILQTCVFSTLDVLLHVQSGECHQ